ncbi:hypothetical protein [Nocardia altamirensis]|uniref:hypothetical protein n=1 Tax=Nocardia altamirensis TaxID=472158 RepID=UPI0008407ABC|nr:hypothetical protein [Nocardia altamirensis]
MAEPTYHEVAMRVYRDDSWDTELTEAEAKVVAAGWVGVHYCPNLYRWVNGRTGLDPKTLLAEALRLWDDLGLRREDWPHEGDPDPSIAAVAALAHYLEQQPA